MLVGEASGEMEAREQTPFVKWAPAGSVLERCINRMGLSRQMFAITNQIRCRPRNNWLENAPWEYSALNHCRPNLDAAIAKYKPRCIIALGGIALRELTGLAGERLGVTYLAGYPLPLQTRASSEIYDAISPTIAENRKVGLSYIPVLGDFHPAFLRRGKASYQGVFSRILQRALRIATGQDRQWLWNVDPADSKTWGDLRYITHPSLDQAVALRNYLRDNPLVPISKDIETPESASMDEDAREGFRDTEVRQIQFSIGPKTGMAIPWHDRALRDVAVEILHLPNPSYGHNWDNFDHKVLRAAAAREGWRYAPQTRAFDTMDMFHHWQPDLPAHLQFAALFTEFPFPWKHLHTLEFEPFYGCLTGESRIALADGSFKKIEDIVRNREAALIRTMDSNGYAEVARVVGWRRLRVVGQKWLRIKTEGTNQPLCLTPDHEVWCNSTWVKAEDIKVGDSIISSGFGSSELIHGTLLGDASCDKRGRLKFTHCEAQKEWFDIKRIAINGPSYGPSKRRTFSPHNGEEMRGTAQYATEIWVSPTLWRKRFYNDDGDKIFVPPPSDASLAVWYCDDGCWATSKRMRAKGYIGNPRIQAQGFCNLDFLEEWFRLRFGHDNVSFYIDKRSKRGGAIALKGTAIHEFFSAVAPYIPIPMQYKLPPQYRGKYCGWIRPMPQTTVVSSVTDYDPGKRNRNYRYCITVDHPEHRFFAMGGLVKNCADTDSTWRLGEFCQAKLKEEGIWGDHIRGYLGQLYEVRPVLAEMEDRGVPIDNEARLQLGAQFDAAQLELGMSLLSQFPEEAKKPEPYKTFPPELKKLPESDWGKLFQEADRWRCHCKKDNSLKTLVCATCRQAQADGRIKAGKWYRYGQREVNVTVGIGADDKPLTEKSVRWCFIPEFNPNSSQQVMAYMKTKGHPVPKNKHAEDEEGNNPDTTNKKELQRLAKKTGDTFYLRVIEYREFSKLKGTYIDGFEPQVDGRVHTTFTFDTGIGQTTSRNPNVQNYIKHGKLAHACRGMIAAEPGMILTEWDFKSCHVLTLGFLSEDENYIRCARLDMHSIMTGHFLKLWDTPTILRTETDAEITARCKWLKSDPLIKQALELRTQLYHNVETWDKDCPYGVNPNTRKPATKVEYDSWGWKHIRDSKIKHAGLGIGNGLKKRGLFERYMELFKNEAEAGAILRSYESVFPKVFAFQERQVQEAHEQRVLKTPFLHIRRFYEARRPDPRSGGWVHGDQAEEAIAYRLANIAFGHIRENLKALRREGMAEKYGLFNNVHDSFLFHFPEQLLEEHVQDIFPILTRPSEVLKHPRIAPGGLVIGVDSAWGKWWNEMQEIVLPKLEFSVAKTEVFV